MKFSATVLPLAAAFLPSVFAVPVDGKSNILIPNEKGELLYATPQQLKARNERLYGRRSVSRRDVCSDQDVPADQFNCVQYCEHSTAVVDGPGQQVSDDIDCSVSAGGSCSIAYAESVTITQSFSIDLGADVGGSGDGGATLSAGASFSWSESLTTGNTYTFTPQPGDQGHISFKPHLHQSCGDFQAFTFWEAEDGSAYTCNAPIVAEDANACGTSPMSISDGEADGTYSFCQPDGTGC